jgi:hypothetical protein
VQVVAGGLVEGEPIASSRTGYLVNNYDVVFPVPSIPADPVTFALGQATLAAGAMLSGPPAGTLQVVTSGPAIAYLPEASDGSVTNLVREPVEVSVLTLRPAVLAAGASEAPPTA